MSTSKKYLEEVDAKVPGNVQIVNQKLRVAKYYDPETKTGAAVNACNELIKLLDAKEDKSSYDRYYVSAYNYLSNYYMNKGEKETAKSYYQKWLDHDPNNQALAKYIEGLK